MGVLEIASDPASAALVRHSIAADLARHRVAEACVDDVVLVASELVTNAVLHAPTATATDLNISWELLPDSVLIEVRDPSPELPHRRTADQSAPRGRGMFIVATLALDWGVRRTDSGKQVWARIPVVRT